MDKFIWSDEWSLGNETIDDQHKILLNILNDIEKGDILLENLLIRLVEYTTEHFGDEEQLMYKNNYPENFLNPHKREHKKFKEALLELTFATIKALEQESNTKLKKLKGNLTKFCFIWFEQHFLGTDKTFVNYLNENA